MQLRFFDAHSHAHFPIYGTEQSAMLARAASEGVGIVTVGTTYETSREAVALARANECIWATIGVHPSHASASFRDVQELGNSDEAKRIAAEGERFDYAKFKELAADPKVVGIGECGLDYYRIEGDEVKVKDAQRTLLLDQMRFALETGKPLMIHCRAALPDLIQLLATNYRLLITGNPGVIHFFSGTVEEAKKLLELGFSFTFGGVITFARDYDDVIRFLPADRILSETDAPYVAPTPYRGKRNEPAYVVEVVKKLAELKGIRAEEMALTTVSNARRVFGI
jgi:TatD DNase family protein